MRKIPLVVNIAASYMNLYSMPPGHRVHLAMGVHKRASARDLADVAQHASLLESHDRKTVDLEILRRTSSRGIYSPRTTALDSGLDRSLSGLDGYLDSQIRLYGPEDERDRAAARLRDVLFPEAVAALPEMASALKRVHALNDEYRTSIDEDRPRVPTGEEVRAAQVRGQELLANLLVVILAHFLTKAPHDEDGLADLLEPIDQQLEAVRLARQRRRVPADVNPDTGDELPDQDGDVPADDAPAAGAPVGGEPGALAPAL